MKNSDIPYSDDEAAEARLFVNKYGPVNSWTALGGTAARIIGRLLVERQKLLDRIAEIENDGRGIEEQV